MQIVATMMRSDSKPRTLAGTVVAGALVGLTFLLVHPVQNAALYAAVQVLLAAVAYIDLKTLRIPNELVAALVVVAIVPRAIGEHSEVAESIVSGLVVFGVALGLAALARGGLGMGDVKLASALGFVLGKTVLEALLLGTVLGAIAGLAIIVSRGKAGRRATIAYGPYLAFGGAVAVLFFGPPPLI
jgi:leader peptidase (prepilin peptidase) / N-methyltransferase